MKSNKRLVWLAFTLSLTLGIGVAKAAVDIADAPLQTGSAVAPNIYFVLDDSGSMQWEVMPDEYVTVGTTTLGYLFPIPANMYGGLNHFDKRIPTFSDDNIHNVIKRSSEINKVFYDPGAAYPAWRTWEDKSFGDSPPTNARWDPYNNAGTFNLIAEQSYNAWYYSTSTLSGGSVTSNSLKYWPITFYVYKGEGSALQIKNYIGYQIRGSRAYTKDMGSTSAWKEKTTNFKWTSSYKNADGNYFSIERTIAEETQHFANWFSYYRSRVLAARAGTSIAFSGVSEDFRIGFKTLASSADKTLKIPVPALADIEKGTFFGSNKQNWFKKLFEVPMNNSTPLRNALKWVGDEYTSKSASGPWGPGTDINQISCRQSFAILTTDGYYNGSSPGVGNVDNSPGPDFKHPTDEKKNYQYVPKEPYSDDFENTLADVAMKYWMNDLRTDLDNNVPLAHGSKNPAFWQHMVTHAVSIGVRGTKNPATDTPGSWSDPNSGDGEKIDDLWHATVNGKGEFIPANNPSEFSDAITRILKAIGDVTATSSNLAGSTTSLETEAGLFQGSFSSGDWSGDLIAVDTNNGFKQTWSAAELLDARDYTTRAIYYGISSTSATEFKGENVLDTVLSDAQVNYLRGDRSKEEKNSGPFRNRGSVLGDIAHSTPLLVEGVVNRNYQLYSWGVGYEKFRRDMLKRTPTVYVGANDGMLHAFDAKTGTERFAYIPKAAMDTIDKLTDPDYMHSYYVDGSSVIADIQDNSGNWKSVLIGNMGRGGNSMFALDVTNPGTFNESNMLWERTYAALGITTSRPLVARLNNNKWVAIIGYGYNNTKASQGGLLVIDLNNNGEILWQIDLPAFAGSDNGMGQIEGWDADTDGNLDWVFAGDLNGNVWKFDLSVGAPEANGIAYGGKPLFTAVSEAGAKQPITGGLSLAKEPGTGQLWVYFGTGKMLSNADPINTDQQSWYGIKDGSQITNRSSQLVKRDMSNVAASASVSARVIEDVTSNDLAVKRGWVIDLLDTRERIVQKPQIRSVNLGSNRTSGLVVASTVPTSDFCSPSSDGWVMAINPFTGGRLKVHYFDWSGDNEFDDKDSVKDPDSTEDTVASGVKFEGMQGDVLIVGEEGYVSTLNSIGLNTGAVAGRVSWREMSN